MDNVAKRLLQQISDLEQKATADTHYYRGCREGITLLLQEVRKAAELDNERRRQQESGLEQAAPERNIATVRKKRKEAKAGADEGGK